MDGSNVDWGKLDTLIDEAEASGGSERSNYQLFIERLCISLDLPCPAMAREENRFNDYVFERGVLFKHPDGSTTRGFIDCYHRGRFVLEAKQSRKRISACERHLSPLPEEVRRFKAGHGLRGTRSWDQVMLAARKQAEDYARALPVEHGYPPFLLVVDVGHVVEVYADFSCQGKNYAQFPDRGSYRIAMDDLRKPEIQARLRAIWTDPLSLDPTRIAAEVTRDIAERLARIAKRLEARHDPKTVAEFLMRCLFTMFADSVGLIPDHGFRDLLSRMRDTPGNFVPALESLWATMDVGGYAPHLNTTLKRFNGGLFKTRTALPLEPDEIVELHVASTKDWSEVEPAIFGTLLERALRPRERSRLGAHYTPRAYVERLIVPTIIEPLRADWDLVQGQIRGSDERTALAAALRFHRRLCTTRVLDPACGTGNFLYVALELMKKLEGEVLEAISALGGQPDRYRDYPAEAGSDLRGQRLARTGGRFTVDPHQFHGLEINPRAVVIADLVLWIGYLKWQIRTLGADAISQPVLDAYGTIRQQDAVITYDGVELLRDASGKPLSRWDGVTTKLHPITGAEVPDPAARVELHRYINPRRAPWPEAEFIVGNPPFIGSRNMRVELGDGYAEACWKARPHVPGGADFVMHFWDEAATRLLAKPPKGGTNSLRRFGFITTNSATQTFAQEVITQHMVGRQPLSLVYALPDHPWLKAVGKAAVRIALTVATKGRHTGTLAKVLSQDLLDTDTPKVFIQTKDGFISAQFTLQADTIKLSALMANSLQSWQGCKVAGSGFLISQHQRFDLTRINSNLQNFIPAYIAGFDLNQRSQGRYAIDVTGISEQELLCKAPALYQYLTNHVRPERSQNRDAAFRENWWLFGRRRPEMRDSFAGLFRIIATSEVAKHRMFQFIEWPKNLIDGSVIGISSIFSEVLATLSSRVHVHWALRFGGRMGAGNDPRYQNSVIFDPFPFPLAVDPTLAPTDPRFAQRERLRELGERLDGFRKARLAEHAFLTMTGLYNALERLREVEHGYGPPLTDAERDVHQAGLISVLREIHDDIDRAVLSAYGWDDLAPRLVGRPGATLPSPHKTLEQEAAEEELLIRLVALNRERAEEEKRGLVRWLRPDYQIPRLGRKVPGETTATLDIAPSEAKDRPRWPTDGLEQIRLVRDLLAKAPAPAPAEAVTSAFGKLTPTRCKRVEEVLKTLVATGLARTGEGEGPPRYFLPR